MKSEKFWAVSVQGSIFKYVTYEEAKTEATKLAGENAYDFYVFEAVGVARSPKLVEYEEL